MQEHINAQLSINQTILSSLKRLETNQNNIQSNITLYGDFSTELTNQRAKLNELSDQKGADSTQILSLVKQGIDQSFFEFRNEMNKRFDEIQSQQSNSFDSLRHESQTSVTKLRDDMAILNKKLHDELNQRCDALDQRISIKPAIPPRNFHSPGVETFSNDYPSRIVDRIEQPNAHVNDIMKSFPDFDSKSNESIKRFISVSDLLWDDLPKSQTNISRFNFKLRLKLASCNLTFLHKIENRNWPEIKQIIISDYCVNSARDTLAQMNSLTQKRDESLFEFSNRCKSLLFDLNSFLGCQADSGMRSINDRTARTSFIRGLAHTQMRDFVKTVHCRELQEVIDVAVEWNEQNVNTMRDVRCEFCSNVGHRESQCRKKQKETPQNKNTNRYTSNNNNGSRNTNNNSETPSNQNRNGNNSNNNNGWNRTNNQNIANTRPNGQQNRPPNNNFGRQNPNPTNSYPTRVFENSRNSFEDPEHTEHDMSPNALQKNC